MSDHDKPVKRGTAAELAPAPPEPPVVARLVIEIRSDGSRTIARGAIEDESLGQRVDLAVEAETPMRLLWKLIGQLARTPMLARRTVRGLLGGKKK